MKPYNMIEFIILFVCIIVFGHFFVSVAKELSQSVEKAKLVNDRLNAITGK